MSPVRRVKLGCISISNVKLKRPSKPVLLSKCNYIFTTCLLASEGPFCRAQADKVLKAFTTWAPGISLKQHTQVSVCSAVLSLVTPVTWSVLQLITLHLAAPSYRCKYSALDSGYAFFFRLLLTSTSTFQPISGSEPTERSGGWSYKVSNLQGLADKFDSASKLPFPASEAPAVWESRSFPCGCTGKPAALTGLLTHGSSPARHDQARLYMWRKGFTLRIEAPA